MSGGVYDPTVRATALRELQLPEPLERQLRDLVAQVMDRTWRQVQGETPMPERLRHTWEQRLLNAIAQTIEYELVDVREHFHHPDDYYPRRSE